MNEEYIDNVKHLIEQKDADLVKELLRNNRQAVCGLHGYGRRRRPDA